MNVGVLRIVAIRKIAFGHLSYLTTLSTRALLIDRQGLAKIGWIYKLRRCARISTLDRFIVHCGYSLSDESIEMFNFSADHRLAEAPGNKSAMCFPKE